MRKLITIVATGLLGISNTCAQCDNIFKRTIYNNDYNLYIVINTIEKNVTIPGQEFMGEMVGYLGDYKDFRKWLILDSKPVSEKSVNLAISNDEGSEDFEATLTFNSDSTYTFKQLDGSTLKIARNRKWQYLPKSITFTDKKK